ncbi:hypothetical protein ACFLUU_00640 [Chloroflexota bacterium]
MPEIKHRQVDAAPEIIFAEIHIPDDKHLGTGSFTTLIKPGALLSGKAVSSIMINVPILQISLNVNPLTGEIPVLLGFADGSDPLSRKVFFFPKTADLSTSHEFRATFDNWEIGELVMDSLSLDVKESSGMGISQEGLLPPGSPIPEQEGTLLITLPSYKLSKDLQEKILDRMFDLDRYFTFYQVQQGNIQINIFRNTDFQFVYRHYNTTFGDREVIIDFSDAERQGAKAFQIFATWSPEKNSLHVGLIHTDPRFDGLRQGIALSQDKRRLIEENINTLEDMLNEL